MGREDPEFQETLFEAEKSRSIVSLGVGAVLYMLFGFLDAALYSPYLVPLLTIRVIVVFLLAILMVAIRAADHYLRVVKCASASLVVTATGIALMCHLTEGVSSQYYAGIALSFVFVAALLTWPPLLTLEVFSIVLAVYYIPFFLQERTIDLKLLGLNSAFLLGTGFLVVLGMGYRTKLAWEVFSNRRTLFRRNQELAELHDVKDRMFQNVSHELRTPLTMMLVPLQRKLDRESVCEEDRRWTAELYRNGLRLLKQINDLLDLARLDSAEIPVVRRVVDVKSLLRRLLADLRGSADSAGVTVKLEAPAGHRFTLSTRTT